MIPLTHHEIIERIVPLARRGRHVDLAATDRAARRIAFKATELAPSPGMPALRETLILDCSHPHASTLTRLLSGDGVAGASLEIEADDLADALDRIEAVPPARQIVGGDGGVLIALSHRLKARTVFADVPMMLTHAAARIDAVTLTMQAPRMRGISADLEIIATPAAALALPEDLLAVLGWPWGRLQRRADRWRSALRLRGSGMRLSRDAEAKFVRTAEHLARTLAEPPRRFHERWRAARWRVAARRSVPLVASIAMIAGAAFASRLSLEQSSVLRMVIFQAPPLLLAFVFCLREIPRVEIPPLPKPLDANTWHLPVRIDATKAVATSQPSH